MLSYPNSQLRHHNALYKTMFVFDHYHSWYATIHSYWEQPAFRCPVIMQQSSAFISTLSRACAGFYVPVLYMYVSEIILLPSWACLIDLPQYLALYHITRLLVKVEYFINCYLKVVLIIPWGSLIITIVCIFTVNC